MNNPLIIALFTGGVLIAGCAPSVNSLTDKQLEQAAAQGNNAARYLWGQKLAVRKEYADAMQMMKEASSGKGMSALSAEQRGNAARQVGDWYHTGLGEPRSDIQARYWWNKASVLGDAAASYSLAMDCQQRFGGKLETDCVDAFETAAVQGNSQAQLVLSNWYAARQGGEKNYLKWLRKSAERGNAKAMAELASLYESGQGVEKREDIAERLYWKAADKGNASAQFWMAEHTEGKRAFDWYLKAARGNDLRAQRWIAQTCMAGKASSCDAKAGEMWLKKAVDGGDPQALYLYSEKQTSDALRERYLELAAKGNNASAQRALANRYYSRGESEKARKAWATLAAKGDPLSQVRYAEMLRLGQGGKTDLLQAFKQYRFAANVGNHVAQYRLGLMRQDGLGVPRNRIHAYAWFSLATTEGMKEALQSLNDLEAAMAPEEIKSAQKLAALWEKRISAGQEKRKEQKNG